MDHNMNMPIAQDYRDNRQYLKAFYHHRKKHEPTFNYQIWSAELGFKNPGYLCNAINGKRKLKANLIEKFIAKEQPSEEEKRLIRARTLVENNPAGSSENAKIVLEMIENLTFTAKSQHEDEFSLIKEWYHLVILELVQVKGFTFDEEWIASKLGYGVKPYQVAMAIKRLIRLDYLRIVEGKLIKSQKNLMFTALKKNVAIQEFHKKSMELAKEALQEVPLEKREFNSSTIAINAEDIGEVKKLAQEFVTKLMSLAEKSHEPDCLMRVNTQAFVLFDKD